MIETEQGTPRSNMKIIETHTAMSDVLLRYVYKVAWWMDEKSFSVNEEIFIVNCYGRGYHPRRTGQEIAEMRRKQ